MCPSFHVDRVLFRFVCTYLGPGTEWRDHHESEPVVVRAPAVANRRFERRRLAGQRGARDLASLAAARRVAGHGIGGADPMGMTSPVATDDPRTRGWPVVAAMQYDDSDAKPGSCRGDPQLRRALLLRRRRGRNGVVGQPVARFVRAMRCCCPPARLTAGCDRKGRSSGGSRSACRVLPPSMSRRSSVVSEAVRDGGAPIVPIPANRHELLVTLFREARRAHRGAREGDRVEAVQRSLLTLILAEIDEATRLSGAPSPTGGGVVVDALRYIERHCLARISLRDVARAVGRSPAYVTTALKRGTGRSAVQWIVSGKMAEARRLLLRSDEMIDVVAERVGYADPTHFIRMFRREHGLTPAAWRAARALRPTSAPTAPQSAGD